MLCFTLCSNNYLAMARTLAESWMAHHPSSRFIVGLVDRRVPGVDYSLPPGAEVLDVEALAIDGFAGLASKYDIAELCTAVKPFFFHHLFSHQDARQIVYLDPDILIFRRFEEVESALAHRSIVLTPQICSPIDGAAGPNDYHMLRCGIFNLGFIALALDPSTLSFLNWWQERMRLYAYRKEQAGLFYDQIWINYVPVFYTGYHILRDLGYNVANWNLHERTLSRRDGTIFVNGTIPLTFFHFSHYDPRQPEIVARYNQRVSFGTRPELVPLFAEYRRRLAANGHDSVSKLVGHYQRGGHPWLASARALLGRVSAKIASL